MITTILGNYLVIDVILNTPKLRKSRYNMIKLSLAFCDILSGLIVLPGFFINITYLSHFGAESEEIISVMKIQNWPTTWALAFVTNLVCVASVNHLLLMSFDRFLAVNFPVWYQGNNRANSSVLKLSSSFRDTLGRDFLAIGYLSWVWIFSGFEVILPMFVTPDEVQAFMDPLHGLYFLQISRNSKLHKIYYFCVMTLIPYTLTVILTAITTIQIKLKLKKLSKNEDTRLIWITSAILLVYTACTLPVIVAMIIRYVRKLKCDGFLYFVSVHALFVNHGVNCLVYSFMSKYFRRSLCARWPLFKRMFKSERNRNTTLNLERSSLQLSSSCS